MSTPTEVIRDNSMANNPEYQRLYEEHGRYAAQLDRLEAKTYLTEEEKVEEVRLKKIKLHLKDQMAAVLKGGKPAA
ncbi:MAG: YdcH family protein [Limisphaerales bacterium]